MRIDYFLSRLKEWKLQSDVQSEENIHLVGLCLDEQIYNDIIPLEIHDKKIDYVVTASKSYSIHQDKR